MQLNPVVVGMDWADEKHAIFLLDGENRIREPGEVEQTPEALAEWVTSLRKRFPDRSIAICLEQSSTLADRVEIRFREGMDKE